MQNNEQGLKTFTTSLSWLYISTIFVILSGLFVRLIVGRNFGAAGLGEYVLVTSVFFFMAFLFSIEIPMGITKFVAESRNSDLNRLVTNSIFASLILGIVAFLFLQFFSKPISNLFGIKDSFSYFILISYNFPLYMANNCMLGILNGLSEFKLYSYFNSFRKISIPSLTLMFVSLGYGIEGAFLAIIFSSTITFLILLYKVKDFISISLVDSILDDFYKISFFSSQLYFANGISQFTTRLDVFSIGILLSEDKVGIYSISILFAKLLYYISSSFQKIIYPKVTHLYSENKILEIEKLLNNSSKILLFLMTSASLFLIVFFEEAIQVLFQDSLFLDSYLSMVILIFGIIFAGTIDSVDISYSSIGRPDILFKLGFLVAPINIFLNFTLIPLYSIEGAALATMLTLFLVRLPHFYLFPKIIGVQLYSISFRIMFISYALTILAYQGFQILNNPLFEIILIFLTFYSILLSLEYVKISELTDLKRRFYTKSNHE